MRHPALVRSPGSRQGACPPAGRHRYFFKLYALDAALLDPGRATKARAELVGTYANKGR